MQPIPSQLSLNKVFIYVLIYIFIYYLVTSLFSYLFIYLSRSLSVSSSAVHDLSLPFYLKPYTLRGACASAFFLPSDVLVIVKLVHRVSPYVT